MAGPADSVTVQVYSKAFVLALEFSQANLQAGWNPVVLPPVVDRLPQGLYYARVQAKRGAALSTALFAKVMILR
jgi:hypothetical protein